MISEYHLEDLGIIEFDHGARYRRTEIINSLYRNAGVKFVARYCHNCGWDNFTTLKIIKLLKQYDK